MKEVTKRMTDVLKKADKIYDDAKAIITAVGALKTAISDIRDKFKKDN